ncbi:MAG: ATP-binding protein [Coleofasciculus sp. B1-GNL1-01]|uniref:AAA family ATPase n=1 Tax=Coleofasciculus sp. B1-GNL1-01 TaxID=3068484 RepID=UPI003305516F
MDSTEALEFINRRLWENSQPVLTEAEEAIVIGIWQDYSYQQIAAQNSFVYQYTRELGANLCKRLKEYFNNEINKRNFKRQIEYLYGVEVETKPPKSEMSAPPELLQQTSTSVDFDNLTINPFTPQQGRIDNPQDFFNREREIRQIFEVINSGSSVVLIGAEGVGKSSLLSQIVRLADTHLHSPRQPIFLDLNTVVDEDDFYGALCDEIGIPETKGARLSRYLKSRQVLLVLDNVGKMTWDGFNRGVRDYLRGLAEGSQAPLKLVLAANESLDELFNDSWDNGKTSPLAGVCQEEIIKPWNEPTARDFIEARLAMTSVRFTDAEINQLVEESGGHPRQLMQLCYRMYSRYLEGES